MPGGPEGPTEVNPPGEEPTEVNPTGDEQTGRLDPGHEPTASARPEPGAGPATPPASAPATGRRTGIGVLVGAIVASVLLVGAYLAAGGPVGPDPAADPCDARPWTAPGNLEEAAQQFALSAADGAACELGVSREELTRAIGEESSRERFMEEHGFSEKDLEDALRAGLNRAVDDAENADALNPLAAAGIRAAIRLMPMSVMVGLLENAEGIFNGDFGSLGGIGEAIDAITGGVEGLDSGSTDETIDGLVEALEGALPEGTTEDLERLIPEDTRRKLEQEAKDRLKRGLDELVGP